MADITKKVIGKGEITDADYKDVKWVGKTKAGKSVQIKISNAINLGNTEFTYAEKDDIVSEAVFTACYTDEQLESGDRTEPWEITYVDGTTPAGNIILGAGKLYIGETPIALSRGGGKFSREMEAREINADGDPGPVKGRITIDAVRATLSINALQIINRMTDLYTAMAETNVQEP